MGVWQGKAGVEGKGGYLAVTSLENRIIFLEFENSSEALVRALCERREWICSTLDPTYIYDTYDVNTCYTTDTRHDDTIYFQLYKIYYTKQREESICVQNVHENIHTRLKRSATKPVCRAVGKNTNTL